MSYTRVPPRKAIRYTEATRLDRNDAPAKTDPVPLVTYREIQARAVVLGINGKQTKEALLAAIEEAENA